LNLRWVQSKARGHFLFFIMDTLFAQLKAAPDLANVPNEHLEWLIAHGERHTFAEGETLFKRNDPIEYMYILLEGALQFRLEQNGQFREISTLLSGGIGGTLPYSRTRNATGFGLFTAPTSMFMLHKDHFRAMTHECFELTQALVHCMTTRARNFTALEQQNEKMAALGRISAGLAHELNNPSAAIVRSADAFKHHFASTPERFKSVMSLQLDPVSVDVCNDLFFRKATSGVRYDLSPLQKADAEDVLLNWLEDHNINDGFDIVGNLVDFSFTTEELEFVRENIGEKGFFTVLGWLDNVLTTERFVSEIGEASKRIHDIVSAVKSYSHLDRANERQKADIHDGIRKTLMIMAHKIKANGIRIVESFAPDLPEPKVFVGELNQVWTNLIDNAVDALENASTKTLEIATSHKPGFVEVCIIDSGEGIPADIVSNIFEPFFTTKQMGKGTGLGLNAVQRIIEQHNGSIKVSSEKGQTEFRVCLPME